MFFIKLRIWAWINSTEINGSLSLHLNEAESTFITLDCKSLHSLCLTEGIHHFQKSTKDYCTTPKMSKIRSGEKNVYPQGHFSMEIPYVNRKYKDITLSLLFSGLPSYQLDEVFLNVIWKNSEYIAREVMHVCRIHARNWSIAQPYIFIKQCYRCKQNTEF